MIKNLINNFFKDWVVFDGRLDRKSFLINISINLISQIVFTLLILNSVFGSSGITQVILGFLAFIIYGCLQINFYSLIVRRLHDNNKSGWWILLFFLCVVFSIGIRQSKSSEEQGIFIVLLITSISLFLYFLFSSVKKQVTSKKISVKNISLTKKPHFFKNYKILIILITIIFIPSLFVFVPYKTSYYKCEKYGEVRSLVIKQYLPNNYSMSVTNNKLVPFTFIKKWCRSNLNSPGFKCVFVNGFNEDKSRIPFKDVEKLYESRRQALIAGDTKSLQEIDEYRKSRNYITHTYRFDPILNHLRNVVHSSQEGEIHNLIYQCEKREESL
jgi:uncharacterized membrane protein YhaH (DUF805 family)